MKNKRKFALSTTQIILLSFLAVIFVGSILLVLPISAKSGESVGYIDALFTATTATCVTGLVTLTTATAWSGFGQAVIFLLIQIGGIGTITVVSAVMIAFQRKMKLSDYRLIGDAFNLNSLSDLTVMVKRVIKGTLLVELCGAFLYMTVFVPEFGLRGVWISVFNSVSAFCNAGIDIIGESSLMNYATNPIINLTTSALIIIGGLGYIVWWDVIRVVRKMKKQGISALRGLTLHSKIVLSTTAVLLIFGAILLLAFEYNNPLTIESMSFFDKIQVAFFQSVTTRTAGFASIAQENLCDSSAILCLVMMFIGGSPVGTAGGIKTTTIVAIATAAFSTIRGKNEVSLFGRNLSNQTIRKSVAVLVMSFSIMTVSTLLLSLVSDASALDVLYETVSATATVGLTRSLTPTLSTLGKIILICTMYFGRVGPISLAVAFNGGSEAVNIVKNPTEEISVG